jgi:hypothetical protein
LAARTEENRRKDHIVAGLIERLPALAAGGEIDPVRDAAVAANKGAGATKTVNLGKNAATPAASPWSWFLRWLRGSEVSR